MAKEKPLPFYGFNGIDCTFNFQAVLKYACRKTDRRILLSAPMTSDSLWGIGRSNRSQDIDQVRGTFTLLPPTHKYEVLEREWYKEKVFPVVNFHTNGPYTVDAELVHIDNFIHTPSGGSELPGVGGKLFKGFIINEALPSWYYLRWFHNSNLWKLEDRFEIILTLGELAMRHTYGDPGKMAELVGKYEEAIDYVVLDLNNDRKGTDPEKARPILRAIQLNCPWVGLAISGMSVVNNIDAVATLSAEFPDPSIIENDGFIDKKSDAFEINKAYWRLDKWIRIFEKNK